MENWIKLLKKEDPTLLNQGYICLPRSILNEITSEDESVKQQARIFTALLIKANFIAGYVFYKKKKVYCKEGEVMTSTRLLSVGLDLDRNKVQRTLANLQQEGFIEITSKYDGQHIRINNYKEITNPLQHEPGGTGKGRNKQTPPVRTVPDRAYQEALAENRRILDEALKREMI